MPPLPVAARRYLPFPSFAVEVSASTEVSKLDEAAASAFLLGFPQELVPSSIKHRFKTW